MFTTDIHTIISENLMSAVESYLQMWNLTITVQK